MEQQTDVGMLLEQGETLLKEGSVPQAAAAYARAVQLAPQDPEGHLGLAETNLALGQYGIVYMACGQVQQLAPQSPAAGIARAILAVLDRRYEIALNELNAVITVDPTRGYVHALRGYCLRRLGQNYDASLAEARAARVWRTHDFAHLFPPVESTERTAVAVPATRARTAENTASKWDAPSPPTPRQRDPRPWNERTNLERQWVRARFLTQGVPVVTYALIIINVAVYLATSALSGDFFTPANHPNVIYDLGVQQGNLIFSDPTQAYRLLTAMFLHVSIEHIGLNMLSLYFVGLITEQMFGHWRYALIYFVAGIGAGLVQAILTPAIPDLGASGAIFGIFGAFGAFAIIRRRALGPAAGAIIGQWFFWLVINFVFDFVAPQIAIYDHIGGLAIGLALGGLLTLTLTPRERGRSAW